MAAASYIRRFHEQHVVSGEGPSEASHSLFDEQVRPREKPAGLAGHQLQAGFQRMVVGVGDIQRKYRRPCRHQRLSSLGVAVFHRYACPAEAAEAMTDENERFRTRQIVECVGYGVQRLFDRVCPARV